MTRIHQLTNLAVELAVAFEKPEDMLFMLQCKRKELGLRLSNDRLIRLSQAVARSKRLGLARHWYDIKIMDAIQNPEPWLADSVTFLEEELPERKPFLIDSETGGVVFYESSINQIFAFRGIGKSVVANALVGALVKGNEWLRFKAPSPRRVLLVDGELPAVQIQERLREFSGASGRLKILSPELMRHPADFPDLSKLKDQETFIKQIRDFHPEVIIFDTLTRCFRIDTNDQDDLRKMNDFLIALRSRGYCVLLIHHAGKNGTQRGRTDLDDNLDVAVKLEAPYGWCPGDGLAFKWEYEKVRHGGRLREFEAEYLPELRKWQIREDERMAEVLEMAKTGKSCRAIAASLDMAKSTVNRVLQKARQQGLIGLNAKVQRLSRVPSI